MITSRHWFMATIVAVLLHVSLTALLLARVDDNQHVLVSAGGFDIGLYDGSGPDAEMEARLDASESVTPEVSAVPEQQELPRRESAIEKVVESVDSLGMESSVEHVTEPVKGVVEAPAGIDTYSQPVSENAVVVQSEMKTSQEPENTIVPEPLAWQESVVTKMQADAAQSSARSGSEVNTSADKGSRWGSGNSSSNNSNSNSNARLLRGYFSDVAALIDAQKDYPGEVKKEKQEGTVIVAFSINRKGELLSSAIQKSSGYALLDKAALATLERSTPFPPIPKSISRDILKIAVPIDYTLITH